MEGVYEGFPTILHGIAILSCKVSPQNLQRILICLFYKINRGEEALETSMLKSQGIQLMFDVGIAESLAFNFIDEEEKDRWLSLIKTRFFEVLDFLCIARYYISEERKNKPLKFDYYMLRFIFRSEEIEIRVHHEKGPRRLPIEDLINLLSERINQELTRKGGEPLRIESLRAF